MARWRPSFDQEYRERVQEFLDNNPDLPFDSPRDLMKYCTDDFITNTVRMSRTDKEFLDIVEDVEED